MVAKQESWGWNSSFRLQNNGYNKKHIFGICSIVTWTTVFILITLPSRINADKLYCFKCLALECPGADANECEGVREFVVGHLRDYYHISTFLPPCPSLNETLAWRLFQINEDECPEETSSTCTAGRIQIKTKREPGQPSLTSHATVLGCAKVELLNSIKAATTDNRCDTIFRNGTKSHQIQHSMELEHCRAIETMCHEEDFCVDYKQSIIKEFKNNRSVAYFDYGLVIGIIAFIIVIFAAVLGASFCSFPLNRPSNLPKPSKEDANLVAVRSTRAGSVDNSELMQKVVDELATLHK